MPHHMEGPSRRRILPENASHQVTHRLTLGVLDNDRHIRVLADGKTDLHFLAVFRSRRLRGKRQFSGTRRDCRQDDPENQ